MWKVHAFISIVLILMVLPIWYLNQFDSKSSGLEIGLDFSKFFLTCYLTFIFLHITISTSVLYFKQHGLLATYTISAFTAILLIIIGVLIQNTYENYNIKRKYNLKKLNRAELIDVIQLKYWKLIPNKDKPVQIKIAVQVMQNGRFAIDVNGRNTNDPYTLIFGNEEFGQKIVSTGQIVTANLQLKSYRPGTANNWSLTFYLFNDTEQTSFSRITKIYTSNPKTEDDGHFLYGHLPDPIPQSE